MIATWKVQCGDALEVLKSMPDASAHCAITSPPYFQLRAYSDDPKEIGREPTVEEYVEHLASVFAELRRVLRPDGTLWLNLGDSYAGGGCGSRDPERWPKQSRNDHMPKHGKKTWRWLKGGGKSEENGTTRARDGSVRTGSIKRKDLIGIPWLVAFALREVGWWLRADIIWHKPSTMPESVSDRPTRSHEFVFLLANSEHYFYDAEAIKEPCAGTAHPRGGGVNPKALSGGDHPRNVDSRYQAPGMPEHKGLRKRGLALKAGKNESDPGALSPSGQRRTVGFNDRWRVKQNESWSAAVTQVVTTRNKRDVWEIGPEPTKEEHFAAFPQALVLPCVLAGTSARGCCPECGEPWIRSMAHACEQCGAFIERQQKKCENCGHVRDWKEGRQASVDLVSPTFSEPGRGTPRLPGGFSNSNTSERWTPGCAHGKDPVPCVVLDPFAGTATTGVVALKNDRSFVGIELSKKYVEIAERRLENANPLFARAAP